MGFNFLTIFALIGLSYKLIFGARVDKLLSRYDHYVYKIHPLVLVSEGGEHVIKLFEQNKINNDGSLTLESHQTVFLHCPGYYNCIAMNKGQQFNIYKDDIPHDCPRTFVIPTHKFFKNVINEARCMSPLLPKAELMNLKCANGKGVLIQVGFIKFPKIFLPLYKICFDTEKMSAIFTMHELIGTKMLFQEIDLPDMPLNRVVKHVMNLKNPTMPYLARGQENVFLRTFSLNQSNEYFSFKDRNGILLIPEQLTPPGDFYFQSIKTAAYIYENTVPIFSSIHDGNLTIVNIFGRMLAMKKSVRVITGTFDLLELPDTNGLKMIYLDEEMRNMKLVYYRPVPKYLYKIFYDNESKLGIAFVTLNNPFVKDNNIANFPCRDITKWFMDINFLNPNPRAGITICCNVNDLADKLPYLKSLNCVQQKILSLDIYDPTIPLHLLRPNEKMPKSLNRKQSKFLK